MPNELEELARLRGKLFLLEQECRKIGQLPPSPPTLRGRLGAVLVPIVRRMLFWYTPALQNVLGGLTQIQKEVIEHAAALGERLEQQGVVLGAALEQERQRTAALGEQLGQLGAALEQERRRTAALGERLEQQRAALEQERQRTAALGEQLGEQGASLEEDRRRLAALEGEKRHFDAAGLEQRVQEQMNALQQERNRIAEMLQQERSCSLELEIRLREQVDHFEQLHEDRAGQNEDLTLRLRKLEERLHLLRLEILEQSRRISCLLEEARQQLTAAPAGGLYRAFEQEERHALDSLHLSFEDEFRGTGEELQQRLKAYLPYLQPGAAHAGQTTVLDIGCGRGEWLELLRREGLPARGVESNRLMVEECRRRQLQVEQADAFDYLGSLSDGSIGNVTVFHVLEHLSFPKLVRLLDEVRRVLQPGGVAIFETPNPDNILMAARNFYYDPTRHRPIPSATLRFLVEARGLCQLEVLTLNPSPPCNLVPVEGDSPLGQRFNRYFYGPQDYAVIGRKV
jgi:SAM-dependent methyltransferase